MYSHAQVKLITTFTPGQLELVTSFYPLIRDIGGDETAVIDRANAFVDLLYVCRPEKPQLRWDQWLTARSDGIKTIIRTVPGNEFSERAMGTVDLAVKRVKGI